MRKQEFAAKEDASGAFEKFVFNEIIVDDVQKSSHFGGLLVADISCIF